MQEVIGVKQKVNIEDWHWPQNRWTKIEYACPHGVGHGEGIHGCDGCCRAKSFKRRLKRAKKKAKKTKKV